MGTGPKGGKKGTPKGTGPEGGKPDVSISEGKKSRKAGKKKSGRIAAFAAAAVVVAVLIAVVFLPKGDDYSGNRKTSGIWTIDKYSDGSKYCFTRDTTITVEELKGIKDCGRLDLSNCQVQQDAVDYMADQMKLITIDLEDCSGFDTLDPLANVAELEKLSLGSYADTIYIEKGWFTKEFPNLEQFNLANAVLKDGGQFLSCFTNIEVLNMSNVFQFKGFPELSPHLWGVSIRKVDCKNADLTAMKNCPELKDVTFKDCNLEEIAFLSGLEKLSWVELDKNKLTSLDALAGIPLYHVTANENRLTDLHGLENNSTLNTLNVAMNQLTDISVLAGDTGLATVDLGKNQLTDISALAGAVSMRDLRLYKNQLTDLGPIAGMKELTTLVISDNVITNLDGCEQLINLKNLIAPHNQLTSISGLTNCTVLETVNLNGNQLTDASVLGKSADKLQMLLLAENQLTDISFLHGATALESLSVHHNALTSLNGLEESTVLKSIAAQNNAITDISALKASDELYYVELRYNAITDISAVSQKAAAKRVLLLDHNNVKDISSLRTDTEYVALALHGNSISDFGVLDNLIGQNGDEEISVEWNGDMGMLDAVASAYNGRRVDVVNVPLDKQVNLNTAFKEKVLELQPNRNFAYDVNYYGEEEMENHMQEMKDNTVNVKTEEGYEYSSEE